MKRFFTRQRYATHKQILTGDKLKISARFRAAVIYSAFLAFSYSCIAAPGSLDLTFNGTGKVTTAVGSGADQAKSVAVQSDGKIVAAGYSYNGSNNDFAAVRYNNDGSLDTSFNGTGKVLTPIGTANDQANSIAIQSDEKIVLVGYANNGSTTDFAVVRYNANGSLDTSFNGNGKVTTSFGGTSAANGVAVQPDGKIVVAGYSNNEIAVARYSANGTLDASFNGNGKVTTSIGSSATGNGVTLQSDGKIIVAGDSYNGHDTDFAVVRYNANGSLDTTFSGTGKVTTPIGAGTDIGNSVALQRDGKIVVAGEYLLPPANNYADWDFALVRYNSNGTLDTTFNGTGKVTTRIGGGSDRCRSVTVQSDGKILAAGSFEETPPPPGIFNSDFVLVRYNANGSLDASFAGGIRATVFGGVSSEEMANSVALQSDGKIVIAGYSSTPTNDFALARYEGVPFVPEIAVEQPAGTDLVDGTASLAFGNVLTGASPSRTFAIRNFGGADLTGLGITFDGIDAADFTVITSPTAPVTGPNGSTTFIIRFAPTVAGAKTAALHIASNDTDESPFDIALTAQAFVADADDDGDGVTNEAEINLASLGFDPLVDNTALRSLLDSNARGLGHYLPSDIQTLALTSPILERDANTGHFHLRIRVDKSPDLITWTTLTGFTPTYDVSTGKIDIDFVPDASNPQFFRVLAAKP